jgi:ubiquinone biosynthesis accessory factor UbiK
MIDAQKIDELVRKISDAMPKEFKEFDQEAKKQVKAVLEAGINKMNMVSREEFDIQSKMLAKTRAKLELLETQVSQLEQKLNQ